MSSRRHPSMWHYYLALFALAIFSLGPMVVMIFNSLKTNAEIGGDPLGPPHTLHWSNFTRAWTEASIGRGLTNSAIITIGTVLLTWVVAGCAAFAMARLRLPGRGAMYFYMLVLIALPAQMFLVPLFFLWTNIGLYDTLYGLIIVHTALGAPFAILLLRSYLVSIPVEFDEAARLDGASSVSVFMRITVPLSLPGFLTIGLITGLRAYNDLFFANILVESDQKLPVSTAYLAFQQGFTQDWALTSASGVIIMAPFLLLFLLMQRRFVEGLTSGGLTR